ncbi:MAG: DUF4168 domain-containing protein [Desulfurivibrionaceae bacterium]
MKKMTSTTLKAALFTAVTLSLALAAAPAMAQPDYGSGAAAPGQAQQQNFDDATVQKFVTATAELGKIQDKFAQRLEGVQDQEEAMEIQQEINEKMVKAVEKSGLDVRTYNAFANKMNADEEFRNKVTKMQEEQNK